MQESNETQETNLHFTRLKLQLTTTTTVYAAYKDSLLIGGKDKQSN